jgi:hypothetical protein
MHNADCEPIIQHTLIILFTLIAKYIKKYLILLAAFI